MITSEQARILAMASDVSYDTNPSLTGYTVVNFDSPLTDPDTGFNAVIFQKTGTHEYIVAFTGTQPKTIQDPLADLTLGTKQWNDNKNKVLAALRHLEDLGATNISFTGHSLGGGLAQYATYDYLKDASDNNRTPAQVFLATYNAFGGTFGLQQMYETTFNPALAAQVDAAHFFASSSGRPDLVSRLEFWGQYM